MRSLIGAALAALLIAAGAPSSATGISSANVTYVKTVPFEAGLPTGARIVDDTLYVAGSTRLSIYDIADPENPALLKTVPIGFVFANEDVDTNGEVLLMSDDTVQQQLHVWDVSDPADPVELAVVDGMNDHTFTCVLDCRYAYGSRGHIVDLRDSANPEVAGAWAAYTGGDGFDMTEIRPGLVVSAARTMRVLDARKDPLHPKELALGGTSDNRLIHSLRWPNRGNARFLLVQGETPFSQRCDGSTGALMTWDSRNWRKTHTLTLKDEYRPVNGTYTDGNPAAGAFGCTAMWFDDHPDYRNGGMVAAASFEHGTRFLNVDRAGSFQEVGYFMPAGGNTIAAYWVTDDLVYAIDVNRGIDILRFDPS